MAKKKILPDKSAEKELYSVTENLPDYAYIRKKRYRIKWLHPITTQKINGIMLSDKNDHNANYKVAAAIILNGLWRLWLVYPILWRWFYFVKQYTEADLIEILALGKKKIPATQYWINTTLATGMTTTTMTMTKDEVHSFHQGQNTVQAGTSQKNTLG